MKNISQMKEISIFPQLIHGFSHKELGNMSFFWGEKEKVLNNRKNFLSSLNINIDSCVSTQLSHGSSINIIGEKHKGTRMFDKEETIIIGDGLITTEKNIFLFTALADCFPCIVFDSKQEILGLLHLSWKSTEEKICQKALKIFFNQFKSKPEDIFIFIGPGIHKESFSFINPIQKQLPGWKDFLEDLPNGETSINLLGYNIYQIKQLNVPNSNIFASNINTAKNKNFFSHYKDSKDKDEKEGRYGVVVGMKG